MRSFLILFVILCCCGCSQPDHLAHKPVQGVEAEVPVDTTGVMIPVKRETKWGLKNEKGEWVIEPVFDTISRFQNFVGFGKMNGKFKLLSVSSREISAETYDVVNTFVNGHARCKRNGRWYLLSQQGKELGPFDQVWDFQEGMAKVRTGNQMWFTDTAGNVAMAKKEIIGYPYYNGDSFSDGLLKVEDDGYMGFVDRSGKVRVPIKYIEVHPYNSHRAPVWKEDFGFGILNSQGDSVTKFKYDYIAPFSEGMAAVENDNKYGYLDTTGRLTVGFKFDVALPFNEGVAAVKVGDSWRLIGTQGEYKGNTFDYLSAASDGMVRCRKERKWGYTDLNGEIIIPVQFDKTGDFDQGYALVKKAGETFYINKHGVRIN